MSWPPVELKITELLGKTVAAISRIENEQLVFTINGGERYRLFHRYDCCEIVTIEDIEGDLDDLVGSPITLAEEVTNTENPPEDSESFLWTFYKLATAKGYVTIRWLGESNGYYSERVDFEKIEAE